jgi:aldose 1-epimerase
MYQLAVESFGGHPCYRLYHSIFGNAFRVVPGHGAVVLNLTLEGFSVLEGHETPEEMERGEWGRSALLFPFPNRLNAGCYTWQGVEYRFPLNNPETGNAIHGFIREESFQVIRIELGVRHALIVCRCAYGGTRPYYPFPCVVEVVYRISRRRFSVTVNLQNLHDTAIPAAWGWHPYFRLTGGVSDYLLRLPRCSKVGLDARMLPSGAMHSADDYRTIRPLGDRFMDDCYLVEGLGVYRLMLTDGTNRLQVEAEGDKFPYFQVFTPPHRRSVALEPMSGNIDAFNNGGGLISLQPKACWRGTIRVNYSKEKL